MLHLILFKPTSLLSLSHYHTHTHILSLSLTLTISHAHTHYLSLSLSHYHTHTHIISLSLTLTISHAQTHTHAHAHTLFFHSHDCSMFNSFGKGLLTIENPRLDYNKHESETLDVDVFVRLSKSFVKAELQFTHSENVFIFRASCCVKPRFFSSNQGKNTIHSIAI